MQKRLSLLALSFCYLFSVNAFSDSANPISPYGLNFSYAVIGASPQGLHGYRTSFIYEPPSWVWNHVHIFLDTGYGHWWVNGATQYNSLNIYSIAPVLRYYFKTYEFSTPFIDLSIGPAYLTKTHLDDHNLGIHYAFQDQIGFGLAFGRTKKITASISALHYSNGSMSRMNAGLNIPFMFNISYRF